MRVYLIPLLYGEHEFQQLHNANKNFNAIADELVAIREELADLRRSIESLRSKEDGESEGSPTQ